MTLAAFNMFVYSYTAESEALEHLIQELCIDLELARPKKHAVTLKVILVNLIYSHHGLVGLYRANRTVAQRSNPDRIGQQALRTVLDALERTCYIRQIKGSKAEQRCTLISVAERLAVRLEHKSLQPYWVGGSLRLVTRFDPVVLKDRAGKEIDYDDNAYTSEVRSFLREYEEFLQDFEMLYSKYGIPEKGQDYWDREMESISQIMLIRRTYNHGSFFKGGRISSPWTQLSKDQRRTLCLYSSEQTSACTEIDMQCSSVNLMYRLATGEPYQGDAYQVQVNGEQVPRAISKKFLSIAQNTTAQGVTEPFSKELKGMQSDTEENSEKYRLRCTVPELKEALLQKHARIKKYLFKPSVGMKIQWAESELVYLVLKKLLALEIPALTVFDSFIVREQDAAQVQEVLNSTASEDMHIYLRNFK